MNLLIMGLPGAGKGTQAAKIVEEFGVTHISTGGTFHAAVASKTEMGILAESLIDRDEFMPNEVTNGIAKERLTQDDIAERGFLLDGYPHTIEQTHALDETLSNLDLKLDGVINIEVNPESLIERLSGHIVDCKTGETFHKMSNPPVGDYNEDDFYQREDDKPEAIRHRPGVNIAQDAPIIEHYREAGIVFGVQGDQDIDDVFTDIVRAISSLK